MRRDVVGNGEILGEWDGILFEVCELSGANEIVEISIYCYIGPGFSVDNLCARDHTVGEDNEGILVLCVAMSNRRFW